MTTTTTGLAIACCWCVAVVLGNPLMGDRLKLESVQVLFRHGERTPNDCESEFITNIDDKHYEPWGYSQLTNNGMKEEYRIGQMLRKRYEDFLPSQYKPEDVYAYSSDYDRTKASLQLVLAALYSPVDELVWNEELDWLPIPTVSVPRALDIIMKPRDCPKFIEALQELYDSAEMKEALSEYQTTSQTLENVSKTKFEFDKVICAYHSVVVQRSLNLTIPSWYNEELYEQITKAMLLYLDTLSYTPELNKLNGGTIVRKFVENLNHSSPASRNKKIFLYSGHDKTVYAFLKAHNLTLPHLPEFGTAVILEKLRDEHDNFFVKFSLWSQTPKKLKALKLTNCEEICPIAEYFKLVEPVLPSDDDMRCLYKNLKPEDLERILNTNYSV